MISSAAATRGRRAGAQGADRRGDLDRRLRARRRRDRGDGARRNRRPPGPGVVGQAESWRRTPFSPPPRLPALHPPGGVSRLPSRGAALGDHAAIARWRRREALRQTLRKRPDLLEGGRPERGGSRLLEQSGARMTAPPELPRVALALVHHPVIRDSSGTVGATSVTPLNVHDLARAARTYGVAPLYVLTPLLSSSSSSAGSCATIARDTAPRPIRPAPRRCATSSRRVDQRGPGRPVPAVGAYRCRRTAAGRGPRASVTPNWRRGSRRDPALAAALWHRLGLAPRRRPSATSFSPVRGPGSSPPPRPLGRGRHT